MPILSRFEWDCVKIERTVLDMWPFQQNIPKVYELKKNNKKKKLQLERFPLERNQTKSHYIYYFVENPLQAATA